jgi:hypothetical protein
MYLYKITNNPQIMEYRYEKTLILGEILKNLLGGANEPV